MLWSRPLVFISYSRKDKEKVDALSRRLFLRGIRTWLDTHDIVGGEWEREIKRGLRHSNFFVACLSQNTEHRGENLQFEYDSALEIQRERLEGEIYAIPVRLEPCEIPASLSHLQCLDLYEPSGWDSLLRALRSKSGPRPMLLALAAVLLLAGLGAYLWLRPTPQSELLAARVQGKAAVAKGPVQLGVTLWKMEPSSPSDPPAVREIFQPKPTSASEPETTELTPVRLPPGAVFRRRDFFQVGVESSRTGYLYIFNHSFRTDGSTGPARLIFPTERIRGGDNLIWPGQMVRLPDRASKPPYWELDSSRPDYAGELLILVFAPQRIEGIVSQEDFALVPDSMVADLEKKFGGGVRLLSYEAPQRRLTAEEAAARDEGAQLTGAAPPPAFIFESSRSAFLATLRIPVGSKP